MENIINNIEGFLLLAGIGLASLLLGLVFYKLFMKVGVPVIRFLWRVMQVVFDIALLILLIVSIFTPDPIPVYDEVIIGGTSFYRFIRYI